MKKITDGFTGSIISTVLGGVIASLITKILSTNINTKTIISTNNVYAIISLSTVSICIYITYKYRLKTNYEKRKNRAYRLSDKEFNNYLFKECSNYSDKYRQRMEKTLHGNNVTYLSILEEYIDTEMEEFIIPIVEKRISIEDKFLSEYNVEMSKNRFDNIYNNLAIFVKEKYSNSVYMSYEYAMALAEKTTTGTYKIEELEKGKELRKDEMPIKYLNLMYSNIEALMIRHQKI